ncbi:MAG: hypothetical protein KC543_14730 [Myxococcales bacterium]|nr:hypothetical protein [Myxococcales bacterium]
MPDEDDRARELLQRHDGNVSAAARSLGVPRETLRDRLRLLGVT